MSTGVGVGGTLMQLHYPSKFDKKDFPPPLNFAARFVKFFAKKGLKLGQNI
jgi:hypothetical protein